MNTPEVTKLCPFGEATASWISLLQTKSHSAGEKQVEVQWSRLTGLVALASMRCFSIVRFFFFYLVCVTNTLFYLPCLYEYALELTET